VGGILDSFCKDENISAFQASTLIWGATDPGRRATRLPWAFIFRAFGATYSVPSEITQSSLPRYLPFEPSALPVIPCLRRREP